MKTNHTPETDALVDAITASVNIDTITPKEYQALVVKTGRELSTHARKLEIQRDRLREVNADLLDALQTLADAFDGHRVTVGDMNQARAAIAKAKGE